MLEVIALIFLWRTFGKVALDKGQPPLKYQGILILCWFSCEMIGSLIGLVLFMYLVPSIHPLYGAYFCCLPGAIIGAALAWRILQKAPNIRAEEQPSQPKHIYNLIPGEDEESLTIPATIHIVEEFGPLPDQEDTFMLNGYNICSLKSGCEYTMRTFYRKNILKISGTDSEIRFIASDDGYVEVHAADGKIIPELFKNYTSK